LKEFEIPKNEPFVIAEIANAHNGSTKELENLVDKVIQTKTDGIKFQFFKAKDLLVESHPEFQIFKMLEIPDLFWKKIFVKLNKTNLRIFVDIFSLERAKFANSLKADGYKIHSSDIDNTDLLELVASFQKPILLSCSGCTISEIDNAISIIQQHKNNKIVLMHGFQGFPTKLSEINLNRINSLQDRFNFPVGYMDHIDGDSEISTILPLLAIGKGAFVIEKHITLDRSLKQEDYQSSLNPDEFKYMVDMIRKSFDTLGNDSFDLTGCELKYRQNMKKKIIARKTIAKNSIITKSDITFSRSDEATDILPKDLVIGGRVKNSIKKNEVLTRKNTLLRNKIAAVIACRIESTRLYGKPLQLVGGKPILEHIVDQLRNCKLIDTIVLAISDRKRNEKFVEFANQHGLKYVLGDDIDVLQRLIMGAEFVNANTVVRVTSEDPIKYWKGIDDAIKQHTSLKADYTECISKLPEGTGFEIIQLDALKKSHKDGHKKHKSELVTLFINENRRKFKINSFDVPKQLQKSDVRLTVDNPEDLFFVRKLWENNPNSRKIPTILQVLELLDNVPEINKYHKKAKTASIHS